MPRRVFIHATNVHQGGGQYLLEALLRELHGKTEFMFSLDDRMSIPLDISHKGQFKRVKPSAMQRLDAERWLAQSVTKEDVVLCFGNIPPLFKLRGHTVVFVQNRYLIDDAKLNDFRLMVRARIVMERLWLSKKMSNASEFIVQTPTMKRLLEIKTKGKVPVLVLPFVAEPNGYKRSVPQTGVQGGKKFDFVYVASGDPHKNHRRLVEAWCLLSSEGLFPSLCLTISEKDSADLCFWIDEKKKQHGLRLENMGLLPHDQIKQLYCQVRALIYPSTFESFGLPLIEARQFGLAILAAELDYVRDLVEPEESFDPLSERSIARAVKRYMGIKEQPLALMNAAGFIKRITDNLVK
jgi:glycosyltransferase involved in cell wall biosynthesis